MRPSPWSTRRWWIGTAVLLLLIAVLLYLVGFSIWFGFVRDPTGSEDYRDLNKAGVIGGTFFGVPAAAMIWSAIRRFRRRFVPRARSDAR